MAAPGMVHVRQARKNQPANTGSDKNVAGDRQGILDTAREYDEHASITGLNIGVGIVGNDFGG